MKLSETLVAARKPARNDFKFGGASYSWHNQRPQNVESRGMDFPELPLTVFHEYEPNRYHINGLSGTSKYHKNIIHPPEYPLSRSSNSSSFHDFRNELFPQTLTPEDGKNRTFSIHNLCYMVKRNKSKFKDICETLTSKDYDVSVNHAPSKVILNDISAIYTPGVNAIMGPSGSGKTSLLTLCAHRTKLMGHTTGSILFNGKKLDRYFVKNSGFVTEGNIPAGTLTIKENVTFSATLRMRKNVSVQEREIAVNKILERLEITHCADALVGDDMMKGISKGEAKRTHIAMELVTDPAVLFLDEPTSGLDAAIAFSIVSLLQKISRSGCNVILSIHQPRYKIFKLFDTLTILSLGNVVYHGRSNASIAYFKSIGYDCEYHENPADYYLDVIHDENVLYKKAQSTEPKSVRPRSYLVDSYHASTLYSHVCARLNLILQLKSSNTNGPVVNNREIKRELNYESSFCKQLMVVGKRNLINLYRSPSGLILQLIVMTAYSLILGTLYFRTNLSSDFGIQNRAGAIFFIMMNQVFGSLATIEIFIKQKPIFMYEINNRYYSVGAYFLAKIIFDIIPMRIVPVAIISTIAYWMIGFKRTADNFFIFVFTLAIIAMAANSIVFAAGIIGGTVLIATNITGLFFIILMIFGGFLLNLRSIPKGLTWIKYISIFRYGYNALLTNEIKDLQFCDPPINGSNSYCIKGNDFLKRQSIPFETSFDFWSNHLALIALIIIFFTLSFITLRFRVWRYRY